MIGSACGLLLSQHEWTLVASGSLASGLILLRVNLQAAPAAHALRSSCGWQTKPTNPRTTPAKPIRTRNPMQRVLRGRRRRWPAENLNQQVNNVTRGFAAAPLQPSTYLMSNNRPQALPVQSENIPPEIKSAIQWCTWKYVSKDDKWTKVPLQVDGAGAKSNDPETWTDFDT